MAAIVSGIQQIGIGVSNIQEAWKWYRKSFGMDVPVFMDTGEAEHMIRYTGGKVCRRTAVFALNMQGGGAFEIWQHLSRPPLPPATPLRFGDLGILAVTLKTANIENAFRFHQSRGETIGSIKQIDPSGSRTYFVRDPYGNHFQVLESNQRFMKTRHIIGGVKGVIIGVSDIDRTLPLYERILGYDLVHYDTTDLFEDFAGLPGGERQFRRVKLFQTKPGRGTFGKLFGASSIELVQSLHQDRKKTYADRFWGDPGFIHACFDVKDTDCLKVLSEKTGYPFTVDSGTPFDMGQATGRFSYTEDNDGTLIEFVETFKIPVVKKLGIYLKVNQKENPKPLPKWILGAMQFSRVKDND